MNETKQQSVTKTFTNALLQNPVFFIALGVCPALGATGTLFGGLGISAITAIVLFLTATTVSILKNILPKNIEFLSILLLSAGYTTIFQLLTQIFLPSLAFALGIYLPLVAVNVLITTKACEFALENKVLHTVSHSLGLGIGYILLFIIISFLREFFGSGTIGGKLFLPELISPVRVIAMAGGAFFVLAILLALLAHIRKPRKAAKKKSSKNRFTGIFKKKEADE